MHEMGIAMQIVEIAVASVPAHLKGSPVERVNLQVGKLSAVVPDSLRFCFDVVAKGTPLEGADLNIEELPVTARCRACGHVWTIDGPAFTCPECARGDLELLSGRELDIRSIELRENRTPDA
jgi:hydrogenase nickel incorporation protein HypA/HybF